MVECVLEELLLAWLVLLFKLWEDEDWLEVEPVPAVLFVLVFVLVVLVFVFGFTWVFFCIALWIAVLVSPDPLMTAIVAPPKLKISQSPNKNTTTLSP